MNKHQVRAGEIVVAQWSPRRVVVAYVIGHNPDGAAILCGRYRGRCFAQTLPVLRMATDYEVCGCFIDAPIPHVLQLPAFADALAITNDRIQSAAVALMAQPTLDDDEVPF